jgi:hypothetical protein
MKKILSVVDIMLNVVIISGLIVLAVVFVRWNIERSNRIANLTPEQVEALQDHVLGKDKY